MSDQQADHRHRGPWLRLLALALVLVAAAAVYFLGYLPRERTTKRLDAAAAAIAQGSHRLGGKRRSIVKRAAPGTN